MPRPRSSSALLLASPILAVAVWLAVAGDVVRAQPAADDMPATAVEPTRLAVVWTSNDADVAHRMALMYSGAAARQGWFDEVQLIVWGPSQKLVVADKDVRAAVDRLRESGVAVVACLACADTFGIAEDLREAGLDVRYMGRPLTGYLKSPDWAVMTY